MIKMQYGVNILFSTTPCNVNPIWMGLNHLNLSSKYWWKKIKKTKHIQHNITMADILNEDLSKVYKQNFVLLHSFHSLYCSKLLLDIMLHNPAPLYHYHDFQEA